MLRFISYVVISCLSFVQPYPYASAPTVPPLPVTPLNSPVYPLAPTARPVLPGVAGYNPLLPGAAAYGNPLLPGAAYRNNLLPGIAGYRNNILPGVAGYRNSLLPGVAGYNPPAAGVAGYNNPYYNQYRTPGAAVPILSYSSEHVGDGTYSFSFTTADGKQAQEAGYLKDAYIDNVGEPQGTQVVQGSYAYISPEGTPIQVNYVADENGFRPSGVHIPADGKSGPIIGDKEKQIIDPEYNQYDPYYRQRYNGIGAFNRPYDPRNPYHRPYDATKYNPYLNNQYLTPAINTDRKDDMKSA